MKKIVVIGGVAGGMSFAARMRRLDETARPESEELYVPSTSLNLNQLFLLCAKYLEPNLFQHIASDNG